MEKRRRLLTGRLRVVTFVLVLGGTMIGVYLLADAGVPPKMFYAGFSGLSLGAWLWGRDRDPKHAPVMMALAVLFAVAALVAFAWS